MNKLYLTYTEETYGGGIFEGQESELYPEIKPSTTEFELTGCCKNHTMWCEEVEVDFVVREGLDIFVVVARYSTGDTFGRSDGQWYIEGVYDNCIESKIIKNQISNGNYKGYKPWDGFFEYLEDVYITILKVER